MPRYNLRIGSTEFTLAETDEPIGNKIGRTLEDSAPQTFVDGGGNIDQSRWQTQEHTREKLLEYKQIRESGGPVASLIEAKALLTFGTGTEWDTENAELTEWLDNNFQNRDLLFIEIGEDGFTYPGVPAEIVETRGGDFSHVELIEPWTIIPKTDNKGRIRYYEQHVKIDGDVKSRRIPEDQLAYFVLNKSNGRDKTGISLIERNRSEIERFYDNQESIKNSGQLHGFPQRHIRVGREGQAPPSDNELRRVRSRFAKKWNELTMFVTGKDVEMDTLEASDFDYAGMTEQDMKILTLSFLLPQELGNVGSDGLGSGMPADLRRRLLEIGINAKQELLATQFIEQIAKPVVDQYSPYDPEDINGLEFDPLEDDVDDRVQRALDMEDYLTVDEIREAGNYEPAEDPEVGESYDTPGSEESQDDGLGGIFNSDGEGGSGNGHRGCDGLTLSDHIPEDTPEWDQALLEIHQQAFEDSETRILNFSDTAIPQFVKDRIRDTIMSGAIFADIDGVSDSERMQLREYMTESLTSEGWTIDGVADQLMQLDSVDSREYAELVAQSETASILNTTRAEGYEEQGHGDDRFYWTGNLDGRHTEACEWLIKQTNPHHGGDPVPMDELKELIDEAPEHDPEMDDDLARPDNYMVHPRERKTFVRYVE